MTNLKIKRLEKGLSQEKIAEAVQVSTATVSRWESGKFNPQTKRLKKIARLLNCSVDELLPDEKTPINGCER